MNHQLVVLAHVEPRATQLAQRLMVFLPEATQVIACGLERVVPTQVQLLPRQNANTPQQLWLCVSPSASALWVEHASPHLPVCAIGPGSLEVLEQAGHNICALDAQLGPDYDADGFVNALITHNLSRQQLGQPVFTHLEVVKGETGRTDWFDRLRAHQVQVIELPVYRRQPIVPDATTLARIVQLAHAQGSAHLVLPSAAAIRGFAALAQELTLVDWFVAQQVFVPHSRLEALARCHGFKRVRATPPGTKALAEVLQVALQSGRG